MHVSHFVEGENPVDDRFERACLQPPLLASMGCSCWAPTPSWQPCGCPCTTATCWRRSRPPPGTSPHRAQTHRSRCGRAVAEQEGTRTALRLGEDFMSFERFGCAISSSRRCRTGGAEIVAISIHWWQSVRAYTLPKTRITQRRVTVATATTDALVRYWRAHKKGPQRERPV
jgi:hypothetical protein